MSRCIYCRREGAHSRAYGGPVHADRMECLVILLAEWLDRQPPADSSSAPMKPRRELGNE